MHHGGSLKFEAGCLGAFHLVGLTGFGFRVQGLGQSLGFRAYCRGFGTNSFRIPALGHCFGCFATVRSKP